jgi:TPP-dependent indolepyruvate ferredoxin oxidoreductase alpha subunit
VCTVRVMREHRCESIYMHMFDAREIEDSLCNTCHECGFLYRLWAYHDET